MRLEKALGIWVNISAFLFWGLLAEEKSDLTYVLKEQLLTVLQTIGCNGARELNQVNHNVALYQGSSSESGEK